MRTYFNQRAMTISLTDPEYVGEVEGDELLVDLPAKFEVCNHCEGKGRCLPEAMRNHAYVTDGSDPDVTDDFIEDMQRGAFDRDCPACRGERVVGVVDLARCNTAQRTAVRRNGRVVDELERAEAFERAMGC